MIQYEALFKMSYGLYIVSSGIGEQGNGYISNSVFQVTAEPSQLASCCNKNNFTAELIKKTGAFGLSILHELASADVLGNFGYKSGKDIKKLQTVKYINGKTGVPLILTDSVAVFECKLVQTFDVGTHWMFIGELISSEIIDNIKEPMTYAYYRQVKKGFAPKNAPTYIDKSRLESVEKKSSSSLKYKCTACGYIYDEAEGCPELGVHAGTSFSELQNDFICPICGAGKEDFYKI